MAPSPASRRRRELTKRLPVNGVDLPQMARFAAPILAAKARSAVRAGLPFPLTPPPIPQGVEPPRRQARYGADYDTDWARRYPARMARVLMVEGVVRPAVGALTSPTVAGLDRLEGLEGPVVFVANHHSHIDTPLMLANLPEPWRHHLAIGAAADYFFGNPVTATLSALVIGAIPIERQKVARRSAEEAAELIRDGWSFLIFPEGGRSPDGWGQPFRGGAAYLAIRCDVPVVPIHLEGTDRVMPKGRSVPRPSPVTITFGSPLHPLEGEDSRRFAARLEAEVSALADEATSDWWSARRRAHAGESPSLQGPDTGSWRRAWERGNRNPLRRRTPSWPDLGQ